MENELCHFTYVTAHSDSPSFPSLHLRHSSLSDPSLALPTSQLILQPFRCFTYIRAHSPTLPSLYLRHNLFSNSSVASPTSQIILQPFFRLSYVTGFSLTSPGEPPMCHLATYADECTVWENLHIWRRPISYRARRWKWFPSYSYGSVSTLQFMIEGKAESQYKLALWGIIKIHALQKCWFALWFL